MSNQIIDGQFQLFRAALPPSFEDSQPDHRFLFVPGHMGFGGSSPSADASPEQTNHILLKIVRDNSSSQYASQVASLAEFRDAVSAHGGIDEDTSLLADFRTHVPLSDYESYRPFVDKFNAKPCKEEDVVNMFSPGLPVALPVSSSTSGTTSKIFPKYMHKRVNVPSFLVFDPNNKDPVALMVCTEYRDVKVIESASGEVVRKLPLCIASGGFLRGTLGWQIDDESRMSLLAPGRTVPWAATVIAYFPSFLIIHGLFFLANRDICEFRTVFATQFVDLIRHIDGHWNMLLSCIKDGKIPDLEGVDSVRKYLQACFHADPERATELLEIGPPFNSEGWFARVWPKANMLLTMCSGAFATALPKVRSILGPNVSIRGFGYGATEAHIGNVYGPNMQDEFVLRCDEVVEFLDVSLDATHQNLRQAWEVEVGKYYEPVLTTRDGLWRYRLGDILCIIGFEPGGHAPLFKYSGREWATIRIPGRSTQIAEHHLLTAIEAFSSGGTVRVQEFTTMVDERELLPTVGFFIEPASPVGPNAHLAPQKLFDALVATNIEHKRALELGKIRLPTIRIVKPGTFAGYRQWKAQNANIACGQVKVPVVLLNPTAQEWFLERVVQEL